MCSVRCAFNLSSAAILLVLGSGCNRSSPQRDPPTAQGSSGEIKGQKGPSIDRQQPGRENRTPVLSGAQGKLSYRPGCLYLEDAHGSQVGLVIPSYVAFDGKRLAGRVRNPAGDPMVYEIGQFVNLSGRLIDNPADGRYACDTQQVLITDYL